MVCDPVCSNCRENWLEKDIKFISASYTVSDSYTVENNLLDLFFSVPEVSAKPSGRLP